MCIPQAYKFVRDCRSGEAWKKARSAVNQQSKPSNVQTYTPGLNAVVSRFTEHLRSSRDDSKQINDVTRPLKRLLAESKEISKLTASISACY